MSQGFIEIPFGDPFAVMNTIGLVAFALVGASKAIREEFDVFGITIVGLAMAFAGGATRDLLVTRTPLALQSPIEISLGLLGVGFGDRAERRSDVSGNTSSHPCFGCYRPCCLYHDWCHRRN